MKKCAGNGEGCVGTGGWRGAAAVGAGDLSAWFRLSVAISVRGFCGRSCGRVAQRRHLNAADPTGPSATLAQCAPVFPRGRRDDVSRAGEGVGEMAVGKEGRMSGEKGLGGGEAKIDSWWRGGSDTVDLSRERLAGCN